MVTAETIKIWQFPHDSPPDSWPVCFTVGAKRHFLGGNSPNPCLSSPLITASPFTRDASDRERAAVAAQQPGLIDSSCPQNCHNCLRDFFQSNAAQMDSRCIIYSYVLCLCVSHLCVVCGRRRIYWCGCMAACVSLSFTVQLHQHQLA